MYSQPRSCLLLLSKLLAIRKFIIIRYLYHLYLLPPPFTIEVASTILGQYYALLLHIILTIEELLPLLQGLSPLQTFHGSIPTSSTIVHFMIVYVVTLADILIYNMIHYSSLHRSLVKITASKLFKSLYE